jgi:transcriptional regulator with XRE-family HTH domain
MKEPWELIKNNIVNLMKEKGMNQSHLAILCGWPSGNVSRYLTGKTVPTLDNIQRMADCLGVPLVSLFIGDKGFPEPTNDEILLILKERLSKT